MTNSNMLVNLWCQAVILCCFFDVIHDPVIINQDNVILDGHRRFKTCRELATFYKEDFKGGLPGPRSCDTPGNNASIINQKRVHDASRL
jgi:hypothetical protein